MSSKTQEGWAKMSDGKELYTKSWLPAGEPTSQIVFIHGFSDHCNRYNHFFPLLAEAGIAVHSFDQRGWGRSVRGDAEKGFTGKTEVVLEDITTVIKSHLPSQLPIFLMGHSMGGQETLFYAARGPLDVRKQLSGFIAMAPWIRNSPATRPSKFKVAAGRAAAAVMPQFQIVNKLDASFLSHDAEANQSWLDDNLCHDTATLQSLSGMLDRAAALDEGQVQPGDYEGLRILAIHGTADKITDATATEEYIKRIGVKDKTLKLYDGVYHNWHHEPEQPEIRKEILAFIERCSQAGPPNQSQSKL